MKNLTQEEFEQYIEMLVSGKITKVKLAKELATDVRTLDNKIQELVIYNPELYERYLDVLSYRQKTLTHIDFEALLIHMIKNGMTVDDAAKKYEISPRTIRRRINTIEDKELVELYRKVADNRKLGKKDSLDIRAKVELLQEREVVLGEVNDKREKELLRIEEEYHRLCQIMSKTDAAKQMGFSDRDRVFKLLNELYKLEIEKNAKASSKNTFRQSLKVDEEPRGNVETDTASKPTPNLERED